MNLQKTALQRAVTGSDVPPTQSDPIPIPGRASRTLDVKFDPPSPTASLNGDKYVLVRAPKPRAYVSQLAEVGVGSTSIEKDDSKRADRVSAPILAPLSAASAGSGMVMRALRMTKADAVVIRVPYSFSMTSATTGICNASLSVTPDSNSAEWGALAALYDEYRASRIRVEYWLPQSSKTTGTVSVDDMSVMAYDPVDPNALTGVRNGCEYAVHTLKCPSLPRNAAATPVSLSNWLAYHHEGGKPYLLDVTLQENKALAISNTGAINYSPGQWKSVNAAGSNSPEGQLKFYGTFDTNGAAVTCVTGIVTVMLHFRRRK